MPQKVHAGVQGAIGSHDDLNNSSDNGGLSEVEQILKQKTFSRQVTPVTSLNWLQMEGSLLNYVVMLIMDFFFFWVIVFITPASLPIKIKSFIKFIY